MYFRWLDLKRFLEYVIEMEWYSCIHISVTSYLYLFIDLWICVLGTVYVGWYFVQGELDLKPSICRLANESLNQNKRLNSSNMYILVLAYNKKFKKVSCHF